MNVRKVHSIDRKALYCQAQIIGIFSREETWFAELPELSFLV